MDLLSNVKAAEIISYCRCCLTRRGEFFDLFAGLILEDNATIAQILRECTSYAVESTDNLSHQICKICLENACLAFRFRRKADASYRYLNGFLEQPEISALVLVEAATQTDEQVILNKVFSPRKVGRKNRNHKNYIINAQCKLCCKHHKRLLDLREHLIMEHIYEELILSLNCRLCESKYTRRDHLIRHLRNIHKIRRDFDGRSIAIDEPEVTTMGQWLDMSENHHHNSAYEYLWFSDNVSQEDSAVSRTATAPATFERIQYLPAPEFVPSGKTASKLKLPRINFENYPDPLSNDDNDGEISSITANSDMHAGDDNWKNDDIVGTITANIEHLDTDDFDMHVDIKHARISGSNVNLGINNYVCNICQRAFYRKYHLNRHMLVHTKIRAFACQYCNKSFARSDQMYRHRKGGCKVLRQSLLHT